MHRALAVAVGGLVVLISGRGSNLQAILESEAGRQVQAVISDNADAAGLAIARAHGKPAHACPASGDRAAFEEALAAQIRRYSPALIALAGFMRILSAAFINAFNGRLVNIHPSLLPAFRGLHTHRRAIAAGAREHGATVHWVSAEVDGGEVIASSKLAVQPQEDEEALAARVLQLEHRLYPRVLAQLLREQEGAA